MARLPLPVLHPLDSERPFFSAATKAVGSDCASTFTGPLCFQMVLFSCDTVDTQHLPRIRTLLLGGAQRAGGCCAGVWGGGGQVAKGGRYGGTTGEEMLVALHFASSSALDTAASLLAQTRFFFFISYQMWRVFINFIPACASLRQSLLFTFPQAHRCSLKSILAPECLSSLTQQDPGCSISGVGSSGGGRGGANLKNKFSPNLWFSFHFHLAFHPWLTGAYDPYNLLTSTHDVHQYAFYPFSS